MGDYNTPFGRPRFLRKYLLELPGSGLGNAKSPPGDSGGLTLFYEERGTGTVDSNIVGTQADTVGVGTNTYFKWDTAQVGTYDRNHGGVGRIGRNGGSGTPIVMYDLGQSSYTLTCRFNFSPTDTNFQFWVLANRTGNGTGTWVRFIAASNTDTWVSSYDDDVVIANLTSLTSVGWALSTWYDMTITVTPTSVRWEIPGVSIDVTDAIPNTNHDYSSNTQFAIGSAGGSTHRPWFDDFTASS